MFVKIATSWTVEGTLIAFPVLRAGPEEAPEEAPGARVIFAGHGLATLGLVLQDKRSGHSAKVGVVTSAHSNK